jgi:peptidoglycan hydrolase CwlO-like protein
MTNGFDVGVAFVGGTQALLLGYLAYKSQQRTKQTANVQDTLDTQVTASLLATQTAVQQVTEEVFKARQDHTGLSNKIDEVHVQVHELRGDVASLSERISAQGTVIPNK